MAEYIDREVMMAEINDAMDADGMGFIVGCTVKLYLKRQPTADVAPVVHCKDCKHFNRAEFDCKGFKICPASGMDVTPDDFCSYADRRDSDST